MNRYLVTGAAGFIGANVAQALLDAGYEVVGVDSLKDYYDVDLKHYRLKPLLNHSGFSFVRGDLADGQIVDSLFAQQILTALSISRRKQGFGIYWRIPVPTFNAILWASST